MHKKPKSDELEFKCISCGGEIKRLNSLEKAEDIDSEMLDDAMAGSIQAGYGSRYDEDYFIVCICDDCIEKLVIQGRLVFYDNRILDIDYKDIERHKKEFKENGDYYREYIGKRNQQEKIIKSVIGENDKDFSVGYCGDGKLNITCKNEDIKSNISEKLVAVGLEAEYDIDETYFEEI